jgi:hypothetical protein
LGTVCFDENVKEFVKCNLNSTFTTTKSPIGYIGLFNPTTLDFCIRNIENNEKHDLRKVTVGRRCKNFDFDSLLDILARKMKIDPPDDFYPRESRQELLKLFTLHNKSKLNISEDDDIRRLLYWTMQSKETICNFMKEWFKSNNLLETNFDCGSQRKSRSKFVT